MTIEIHRPELEALIREQMNSGGFHDVEDVIMQALRSAPVAEPPHRRTGKELVDVCAKVRGLLQPHTLIQPPGRF